MPLKILSLNLWNRDGPWSERAALVRSWLDRLQPDLIGFQEVLRGSGVDQLHELLDGRGYHTEFARACPFWEDASLDFGNAVASRWPISDTEALNLPNGGLSDQRVALSVTTESPAGPISFTTTHLMHMLHAGWLREQQVQAVSGLVLRRRPRGGLPPIVCGDFNATPDSTEMRYMRGLQSIQGKSLFLLDAWEQAGEQSGGHTFAARNTFCRLAGNRDLRIDYVFVGPSRPEEMGRIERCAVVCDEEQNGVFPSDHFGVYVELSLDLLRS